jgi:hexosaminidase
MDSNEYGFNSPANAPLIQPVSDVYNLSTISKQLLLAIEEKKMSIKALSALLEQFTIRNSADVELAVYDSLKATITIKFSSKKRH